MRSLVAVVITAAFVLLTPMAFAQAPAPLSPCEDVARQQGQIISSMNIQLVTLVRERDEANAKLAAATAKKDEPKAAETKKAPEVKK